MSEKYKERIDLFKEKMPYRELPYSKKNWGNNLHSLCSYQGKLKPAIAYWLIKLFTEEEDVVLDPLGGVGTIPFEACLQGRKGISNDISPFALTIAAAKVSPPSVEEIQEELEYLKNAMANIELDEDDYRDAEFGLNACVKDYFHPDTLVEILKARKYFLNNLKWTNGQNYIRANLLHILHGNRPYALSRKSHSITPFKPTGEFEYKSLIGKLEERLNRNLLEGLSKEFVKGEYYFGGFEELGNKVKDVDCIITSPPFVGMRFDRPNWMRLWFCGWGKEDFATTSLKSLDRKQKESWDIYHKFFDVCAEVLKKDGLLILHLGGSDKYNMEKELIERADNRFGLLDIVTENVEQTEKHGIKDKGLTNTHKYVFLRRK